MRVVRQQKTASEEILAEPQRFILSQIPTIAVFHIYPRPVEQLIRVRVDHLFHPPSMETREPPHAHRKLPVRLGIIRPPELESPIGPVIVARPEMVSRKGPLGLLIRIGGKRRSLFVVFLKYSALIRQQAQAQPGNQDGARDGGKDFHEAVHPNSTPLHAQLLRKTQFLLIPRRPERLGISLHPCLNQVEIPLFDRNNKMGEGLFLLSVKSGTSHGVTQDFEEFRRQQLAQASAG